MATEMSERESSDSVTSPRTSAAQPPSRRSFWRVSLDGILIFAAGMMVGFAPMRAWMFFRDEPKQVVIEAILFDALEKDSEKIRTAFAEVEASDASRGLDAMQILSSRATSRAVLSRPSIVTNLDQTAEFKMDVGRGVVAVADVSSSIVRVFGVDATFTPSVRPSGRLELAYAVRHTHVHETANRQPVEHEEATIVSSAVVESGVWRLIDMGGPTSDHTIDQRRRWLLLRLVPYRP